MGVGAPTFVHGLIVGPTLKPFWTLLSSTRFTMKLLPVRYLPTIEMTPSFFPFKDWRKATASGVIENPRLESTLINSIAFSWLLPFI